MKHLKPFYIFERYNGYWYVKYKDGAGKAMTAKSMRTKNKNEALRYAWLEFFQRQEIEIDYYARDESKSKDKLNKWEQMTVIELLSLYWDKEKSPYMKELINHGEKPPSNKRISEANSLIKILMSEIGNITIAEVTADDINIAISNLKSKRNWRGATSQKRMKFVRQAFKFFYEKEYIKKDIAKNFARYKNDAKEKPIFKTAEIKKIIANPKMFKNKQSYLANATCILTGCRIGEMQALQFGDIIKDGDNWQISFSKNWTQEGLKATKTNRSDTVYIPEWLALDLLQIKENYKVNDFIFANPETKKPFCQTYFNKDVKKVIKSLGIYRKGLSFHSYRHNYTIALRDKGYTHEQILVLSRHSSYSGLKTYLNHTTKEMQEEKLQASEFIASLVS